jgi:hypothetical protein
VRLSEALDAPVMGEECGRSDGRDVIAGCAGIPFRHQEVMSIDNC